MNSVWEMKQYKELHKNHFSGQSCLGNEVMKDIFTQKSLFDDFCLGNEVIKMFTPKILFWSILFGELDNELYIYAKE